jgi:peptide/nickel transport system substrate-binding protein
MVYRWLGTPKVMILAAFMLVLVFIVACGGTAATAVPAATAVEQPQATAVVAAATTAAAVTTAPQPTAAAQRAILPTATPGPTATPAPAKVARTGGHVNMSAIYELRPSWVHASVTLTFFVIPLHNSILQFNPNTADLFDIECDICSSWELAEDGLTYTFHIPDGIEWHDGTPFTGKDLDTTVISMVDPFQFKLWEENDRGTSGWVGLRNYYESHLVPDDNTLVIKAAFPAPALPVALASATAAVMSYNDVINEIPQMGAEWELLNGTGPYRTGVHEEDVKTEYLRNDNYFKDGLPYVDSLTQFVLIEPSTLMAAFETEQILTCHHPGCNLNPIQKAQLKDSMGDRLSGFFQAFSSPRGIVLFGREPFVDQRVRRAIWLAIYRQPIIETLAPDAMTGPIPFGFPWSFTEEEISEMPGFRELNGEKHPDDIAAAKALLEEAGLGDGFSFELSYRQFGEYGDIAVLVAQQLKDYLNIDAEIKSWESTAGYDCYREQCTQAASQSIGMNILDADGALDAYRTGRFLDTWTQLVMPRTDELYAKQQQELDPVKRRALVQEWALLHAEDPNYVNIWWNAEFWIYNSKIQNFQGVPDYHHWEQIWCDPSC